MNDVINLQESKNKPKKSKANWKLIRLEFETGNVTMKELSEKYNVSWDRIRHKSSEQNWSASRLKLQEQMREELLEKALEENVINASYIIDSLRAIAENIETNPNNKIKALELLGKSIGLFKDNVVVNTQINNNKKVEDLIIEHQL